jgi:IS5 family transposase
MDLHLELQRYMDLLDKHIDLVERRLLKGETIPHDEKIFSIFEEYTEWITKGKRHPNVELGKNTAITTDQYHLIVDYHVMDHETDAGIIIPLFERIIKKYKVDSWSFDRGFWNKDNKEKLMKEIAHVIMPRKGKKNKSENEEESQKIFKKFKNKHSAIESNINELEHHGLDRCPDRGYDHFKRYIGLAVCAYNLKRIGKELLNQKRVEINKQHQAGKAAA